MSVETLSTFESSLGRLDVDWTRAAPEEVASTLESLIQPPAVGVPLPFDGVALPDGVNTRPTPADLDAARTGITPAGIGVADYGTVVLQSTPEGTEPISLFPDHHVVVLRAEDVVPDMPAAFEWLGEEFRAGRDTAILATGPSATADMGALVKGVHGPNAVHVVIVE